MILGGGSLKALIGEAIPLLHAVSRLLSLCVSLSRSASILPSLCLPLTGS